MRILLAALLASAAHAESLPALDTLMAIAEALSVPLREFFPEGAVTENKSANRMRLEAEVTALLRGLSDERAKIALGQLRAMAEA